MRNVGGGASAGCGAFGLLSILLGVGISAFLGAKVMGSLDGNGKHTTTTTTPTAFVNPSSGLHDGSTVTFTTTQLPANRVVLVSQCMNPADDVLADDAADPRCAELPSTPARTDRKGHLRTSFTIHRVISIDARPLDCASQAGLCIIHAVVKAPVGSTAPEVDVSLTIGA